MRIKRKVNPWRKPKFSEPPPYELSIKQLKTLVDKRIDVLGYCPINQKHMLQIRGKDYRRLKKLGYYQVGRRLYRE